MTCAANHAGSLSSAGIYCSSVNKYRSPKPELESREFNYEASVTRIPGRQSGEKNNPFEESVKSQNAAWLTSCNLQDCRHPSPPAPRCLTVKALPPPPGSSRRRGETTTVRSHACIHNGSPAYSTISPLFGAGYSFVSRPHQHLHSTRTNARDAATSSDRRALHQGGRPRATHSFFVSRW